MKRASEEETMEQASRPARSEFSLLPWMVAKATGGITGALGSLAWVWTLTHAPQGEQANPWPVLILALAGFLVFIGAGRALSKHADAANPPVASAGRASVLSWTLLLLLAAGFLLFVHFMTR
jgi:heme A synthase